MSTLEDFMWLCIEPRIKELVPFTDEEKFYTEVNNTLKEVIDNEDWIYEKVKTIVTEIIEEKLEKMVKNVCDEVMDGDAFSSAVSSVVENMSFDISVAR